MRSSPDEETTPVSASQSAPLLFHLVTALGAALVGAALAAWLRQSMVVGYLLAGLAIGPFTPGFRADPEAVESLAQLGRGCEALLGDATQQLLLERARVEAARLLVVCLPERLSVRQIVDLGRRLSPKVEIVVRTHSEEELGHLYRRGVTEAVMGELELELALELGRRTLRAFGIGVAEAERASEEARRQARQGLDG
jgi:voltage-gated potassium channel Kch